MTGDLTALMGETDILLEGETGLRWGKPVR